MPALLLHGSPAGTGRSAASRTATPSRTALPGRGLWRDAANVDTWVTRAHRGPLSHCEKETSHVDLIQASRRRT
ncbi:MAG TPA: hypothetical protein DDZ92_10400 [Halomonas sp.]|nr:hypothetical protein [Halomonas sp.]